MPAALITLDIRNRAEWRQWLAEHHAASPGIWLLRHKAHTAIQTMSHEDLVREALCYGWVDSLIKRVDDDRYLIKVTPRRRTSRWSDVNRRRWSELENAGLLAPAGLAAAPTANTYAPKPAIPALPAYVATALKTNAEAWRFFQSLPARQRRDFVVWIHTARRSDTRARRLRESLELLSAGKTLGLK